MSNQDYVHIGVYVECVNPQVVEQKEYLRCMNGECVNYRTGLETPYCPQCGKTADEYQAGEARDAVDVWKISEAINEGLSCVIYNYPGAVADIWIANYTKPETYVKIDAEGDDHTALELTPHMRTLHLDTFEATYAVAIAILIAAYGADNVTVKWGVVKYTR